jgi:hypothetical protein
MNIIKVISKYKRAHLRENYETRLGSSPLKVAEYLYVLALITNQRSQVSHQVM